MQRLQAEPRESGQHGVVHHPRHELTANHTACVCYRLVDEEAEVEQEQGHEQVDEDVD